MFLPAMMGAVAGGTVDESRDVAHDHLPHLNSGWEQFIEEFPREWNEFRNDIKQIVNQSYKSGAQTTVNLQANGGYTISRQGRAHVSMLCTTSFNILVRPFGLGYYTVATQVSWNALDYPDGTTIELPQGTAGTQTVLFYYTDHTLGKSI